MNKFSIFSLMLVLGSSTVLADLKRVVSNPTYQEMLSTYRSCLKMPEQKFSKLEATAKKQCLEDFGADLSDIPLEDLIYDFSDCVKYNMVDLTGLSDSAIDACETMAADKAFENEFGVSGEEFKSMSTAERQAFITRMSQDDIGFEDEEFPDEDEASALMATRDVSSVTLPIMPGATPIMHLTRDQSTQMLASMGIKVDALPGATFASSEDQAKITAYYKKQLPRYKVFQEDGKTILMKTAPANFDSSKDVKIYASTPHVLIEAMDGSVFLGGIIPKDTQTKIEIAYKP